MGVTVVEVDAGDGRRVEAMHTDVRGRPVVVTHGGTPSGVTEWPRFDELAEAAGLAVVSCNRPGYGASTARPGRTVATVAEDTRAVLDHLGVHEFVSLGVSGGGPHALADGACLGARCRGVVDVAGLAPPDLDGLVFLEGMADDNRALFAAAVSGEGMPELAEGLQAMVGSVTAELLLEAGPTMFPAVDAAALAGPEGPALAEFFAAMTRAAFASGTAGLVDDMLALTRPWGFDLASIDVPVVVWHGELDENVPQSHGRAIAAAVPSSTTRFRPEHGHLSILLELPAIVDDLATLAGRSD